MDHDIDVEPQSRFVGADAENLRNSRLQSILNEPFAGKVTMLSRDDSLYRADHEYSVLDLTNKLVFWTDASKRQGRVGLAVVWRPVHHEQKWRHEMFRLDGDFDSYYGEFFAVAAAVKIAMRMVRQKLNCDESRISSVVIYSDSTEALRPIRDFHARGMEARSRFDRHLELARLKETAQNLVDMGVSLELVWVKGHSNVEGNARADKFAALATQGGPNVEEIQPTSRSFFCGKTQRLAEARRKKEMKDRKYEKLLERRRERRLREEKSERLSRDERRERILEEDGGNRLSRGMWGGMSGEEIRERSFREEEAERMWRDEERRKRILQEAEAERILRGVETERNVLGVRSERNHRADVKKEDRRNTERRSEQIERDAVARPQQVPTLTIQMDNRGLLDVGISAIVVLCLAAISRLASQAKR